MIFYFRPINAFLLNYFENGWLTKKEIPLKIDLAIIMVAPLKVMLTFNYELLDIKILLNKMVTEIH